MAHRFRKVTPIETRYREIRIENTLEDAQGKKVKLKEGAEVDVTIEADPKDTAPKETSSK